MAEAFTLVQITDPHLHANAEGTLLGMNTESSLKMIVERVQDEVSHIDLLLATGDIAQDSSVGAYRNFIEFVKPLNAPMRWVPGNHDSRENMTTAGEGTNFAEPIVELGDWVIVMLDSIVPERVYGTVDGDQLDLLRHAVKHYPDKHLLVALHHHPVMMDSQWIDRIGVRNKDELNAIIQAADNIRAVVCGHVHQDSDQIVQGKRYLSTPSTCVQFMPKSQKFGIDTLGPGYRKLVLHPDGAIETTVSRIEGVDFKIDYSQKGY